MRPEVSHLFLCVFCFYHFSLSSLLHFLHTILELFRELFIGQLIRKLLRPANQINKNVYKPAHYSQSTIINKCLKSGSDINGTLIFALLAERGGSATVKLSLFVFCHRLLHPLSPKKMHLTTGGFQVAMQALLPPEETSLAACFICSVFAGCDGMNLWNFFMRAVDFRRFCIPVLAIFPRFLPSLFPLPSHCGFLRILKYETSQTNYFSAVSLFVSAKDESPGSASPRIPPPMFTL